MRLRINPSFFVAAALLLGGAQACDRGSDEIEVTSPEETQTQEPTQGSDEDTAPTEDPGQNTPDPIQPPVNRNVDSDQIHDIRVRLGLDPPPNLLVGDLLTRQDIREVTQYEGAVAETTFDGIEPSPNYNAVRIAAEGGFGFGLQLWSLDESRQVSPRYDRLQQTYFRSTEDESPVGDRAFIANFEGIRQYGFMHRASRSVGVVSCDANLCSAEQVEQLAQNVLNRL